MQSGLIPNLFFFFGVLSLIYAVALHYYLRPVSPEVVGHWSLGSFYVGAAVLLTTFRFNIPWLVAYVMANALAYIAYIEFNRSLKLMAADAPQLKFNRWLDLLQFILYSCLLYVIDSLASEWRDLAKICFVSLPVVVLNLQGARYCVMIGQQHKLKLARNFSFVYVGVASLWFTRCVAGGLDLSANVFDSALINRVIFLLIFVAGIAKYIVFPLLVFQKVENHKQDQLRASLARANKTFTAGALSACIAHELNQPLAAIRLNGHVLRRLLEESHSGHGRAASQAQAQAIIDDIITDNERAAKIIQSLRSIFSQATLIKKKLDSARLILKSVNMVAKRLENSGIKLELRLTENLAVSVAEDETHQVLLNLLLNSIAALEDTTPPLKRVILIEVSQRGSRVCISVADSGPGVAKERESSLFEILTSTKDSSMGIGLWLCKYIVYRMDGTITYGRSTLGGARFTVCLPGCKENRPVGEEQLA